MKKTFARFLTLALVLSLLVCCFGAMAVSADEPEDGYKLFIAYGGDVAAENDWGWSYAGTDVEGVTAVTENIKVGETKTVSLTFATPTFNSWYFAPCLVGTGIGESVGNIDFTVTCKIDGVDVPINMEADAEGKTWWSEGTGDFAAADCIRLAGGYNEWATKYIEEPASFTTIEYTITLNAVDEKAPAELVISESEEVYTLFVAYGGDKEAENDWGWGFTGDWVDGIVPVTAAAKVGDTVTISLTFDTPTFNSWYFAPCLTGKGAGNSIQDIDFDITCKIDGVEVPINMEADAEGKTWWPEGTGDNNPAEDCIRLAGGYNEWGTKYIEEPGAFTTIEYTITLNSILVGKAAEPEVVEIPIDLDGTFNAYLMLQTPNWTFRDACDSANGIGSEVWGPHITNNDSKANYGVVIDAVIAGNGTYSVSITDFGTIFADDFAAAGQDYFNIIGISTDIPKSDKIQITNVELLVDGQVRHTYDNAVLNPDAKEAIHVLVQNKWNDDVKEISYYPTPTESLEIRFTVSGFNYDNESLKTDEPVEDTKPVETPSDDEVETPAVEKSNTGVIVGIVIAVVVVAAVVVVVVLKKKK